MLLACQAIEGLNLCGGLGTLEHAQPVAQQLAVGQSGNRAAVEE
jgi:hypothetical protein